MERLQLTNTRFEHAASIAAISYMEDDSDKGNFAVDQIHQHIRRFPQGQFVALMNDLVVGYAITMRTNRPPTAPALSWYEMMGDMTLRAHRPNGTWLYGIDFYVHPEFRKCGIGSALYQARFDLVCQLGLKGFYAGGLLAGYHRYCDTLSVREYAEKVTKGEITDPTITMQMNRGFRPTALIENYTDEDAPNRRSAMLIVWDNPTFATQALYA